MNFSLIIITGASGAGKSTLARWLANELRLPLVERDGFKEVLYDTLGWSDAAWSQKLGSVSYDLLYHALEGLLRAGVSAIVESNFNQERAGPRFVEFQQRYGFQAIQILCTADHDVIKKRIKQRVESGERHPGHVEHLREQRLPEGSISPFDFMALEGPKLTRDTTNFELVDDRALLATIQGYLAG